MNWIEEDGALRLEVRTPDFATAFARVQALVEPAERLNHHPDIAFGWGYVRVTLRTHDAGRVTELDHRLAALIDEAWVRFCD